MGDGTLIKKTKRGLYWKFAEQFSNYGVQFVIGIFMARLLSPSDFGITALPAVFMAIAGIFIGAGFEGALVRKKEIKEEDLSTAFYYSMAVGVLCYSVLFGASPWIADFYNTPVLKPLMRVTALSFLFSPIGVPQRILLKRELNFKTPAKISVFVKILSGFVGIAMAYSGYGLWSLVISGLFSSLVGVIITISVVRWYPKVGWSRDSFNYLWGYGNKMMASALLDTIYNNITPIIVGKFYSTADLGIYNRAHNYASLPSSQVHRVIMDVSFPVLSKLQDDDDKLIETYRRMIKMSTFVIFPMMFLLSALARPLIITLITEKWEASIILLQIICFSLMWYPVSGLNLNILMVKGRTDLFLKLEIAKKCVGLFVICAALPFGLVAFCAAGVASSLIILLINTWYTGKWFNYGLKEQLKDVFPTLILCSFIYIIVSVTNLFISNMLIQILIGFSEAVLIYFTGARLFNFSEIEDVKILTGIKR